MTSTSRPEGAKELEERVRAFFRDEVSRHLDTDDWEGLEDAVWFHIVDRVPPMVATLCAEYAREQVGAAWLDADVQRSFAAKDKATDMWRALSQRAEARTQDCLRELAEVHAQLQTLRGENERLRGDLDAYYAENGKLKEEADDRSSAISKYISVHQHQKESIAALTQETAALEARLGLMGHRACPCVHTTPCDPMCTCVNQFSSRGCARCCSYGSKEQQRAAAEHLVSLEARERALREDRDKYRLHVADSVGSCCDVAGGDGGCIHDVARAALAPRQG